MQWFRVEYRGICHASLVFSVYTRAFRRVCIRRKYKWQEAFSRYTMRMHCITNLSHVSVRENCSKKFGSSSAVSCSLFMSLKQFLLYARNSRCWPTFRKRTHTVLVPFWYSFASNGGKIGWNTIRWILPVGYRKICNGFPSLWLAVFLKARDTIQYNTIQYNTIQYNAIQYKYSTV